MASIKELINQKSNNYGVLERAFTKRTGANITRGNGTGMCITKSCSIVIPFYKKLDYFKKNLLALSNQQLSAGLKNDKVEIVIVNDGSQIELEKTILNIKMPYRVTCLKLKENAGRSNARNLGLLHAKNEIVIFMDEDVVAPRDFLITHLLRHEISDKCAVVGLRQNISLMNFYARWDSLKRKIVFPPDYKDDFRFKKFIPSEWIKTHPGVPKENFDRICFPLKESGNFKNFGFGKIIGAWRLPSMFLTCNVSMPRLEAIKIGGFDMRFKGWVVEDVHLAAKLIASGIYIVPNLHSSVYHLVQKSNAKETKKKIMEFEKNACLYEKLIEEELEVYGEAVWKDSMGKFFADKFIINIY